jgi:hypothetical protein
MILLQAYLRIAPKIFIWMIAWFPNIEEVLKKLPLYGGFFYLSTAKSTMIELLVTKHQGKIVPELTNALFQKSMN